MPEEMEQISEQSVADDYSRALTSARIACYDDFRSAPRITVIEPTTTAEFIEALASTTYTQAQMAGGTIPYTVIREVSENFIHAQFKEIIVSIFDKGKTIRFSDQGPGISQKDKAVMPGFSSATAPMKQYIRGVGSGLPIVREYLSFSNGRITIEDNLKSGAVITISVAEEETPKPAAVPKKDVLIPELNGREKDILFLLAHDGSLRLTDIVKRLDLSNSTVHRSLGKLEEYGLIESTGHMKSLTEFGKDAVEKLF
ncbi:Predicted transcriptional regulator [Slackia heliotrinireducens]|uniref:Histidine kinase n=2 Tax=Slackia TaxID=84108 RepID=C7N4A6_SLAHD|nr:histidine kinase [Slackia heliotrinireducens DSM 20476]VEH03550.1 Predicted transcriptional regulator [Slackia heliotrinireducens]